MRINDDWNTLNNFGDALNNALWPLVFDYRFDPHSRDVLSGIGTIILSANPFDGTEYILGAGCDPKRAPFDLRRRKVYATRGPLSARALGADPACAGIDPAMLIPHFFETDTSMRNNGVCFMPHHSTHQRARKIYEQVCSELGIHYLAPTSDIESVLNAIAGSEFVVTEALHGAIAAESLGIRWIPVRLGDQVLDFKWRDWCASIGIEYRPAATLPKVYQDHRNWTLPKRIKKGLYRLGLGKPKYADYKPPASEAEIDTIRQRIRQIIEDSAIHATEAKPDIRQASLLRLLQAIDRFSEEQSIPLSPKTTDLLASFR